MRHLASAPAPLTHAEAADSLEPLGIDRSTVFRCLNDLAEAGLATRFDLGDHMWRFGMRGCEGQEVEEHPHFLCTSCGKAVCLHQVKVRITPVSRTQESQEDWGDIEEVILKGHCPACRA